MQRLINLSVRASTRAGRRGLAQDFEHSNGTVRMGLPFSFEESKALDYFNRWRKSFWLAPGEWQNMPVTITRRYLPYWSFSLNGSVSAEAYINRGSWLGGGAEWFRFDDPVVLTNVHLSDVNVYAAHTYDRQHILEIDMKKDAPAQALDAQDSTDDSIEQWTVDRDTAFEIGWDLTVVNHIQDLCVKELKKKKKGEYRISSIRFPIERETQELIHFPVYIVDYQYHDRPSQALINGRTGKVAGLRQFSRAKMTGVFMGVLYPVLFTSATSIFSLATFAVTQRFVIIPCALVAAGLTFPIVSLAVLQISKYIQDYSHLYRGKRDIRDWLSFKQQNPNIFTEKTNTQRDGSSTFDREQTREARKPTYSFDIGPDLYGLLGVNRVASDADIKQAYLEKAKEYHPDRNIGNKQVEETFKLINRAYAILSDPEQRELFDQYGYEHVKYK